MRKFAGLVACAVALLLSACGAPKTTLPPIQTVAHTGQTADQILAGLKGKGLPVGASITFTADTDINSLLGRPGQYIGKVNFKDTRTPDSGDEGVDIAVEDGGSVEVFANVVDATKRFQYVQNIATSGAAIFSEYDYQDGDVVLRISHLLDPTQAQAYDTALKSLP